MTTKKKLKPWTDEECGYIIDNAHMSARELGEVLERGMQAVQHKRTALLKGWTPEKERWSADDDDMIRATAHMTAAEVAKLVHRSTSAILNRRGLLRRSEGVKFDEWGPNKSPFRVGARRLLAKTCPDCGLLLDASWYGMNKTKGRPNQWMPKCTRCRPRNDGHLIKNRGNSARDAEARFQALSLPHAHNQRQPLSENDHKVLADPELTPLQKALTLGRTYHSVLTSTSKFGYASKVGKGDPMKGRWLLENPNLASDGTLLITVPEHTEAMERQLEPMWV